VARRSVLGEDEEGGEINLSPMIDCVFILLIFFIVTTVFVEEQGFQVHKPDAAATESQDEIDNVVFRITEKGQVLYDGRPVGLGDVTRYVKARVRDVDTPVVIRAHEKAAHGTFVAVWDAARRAGAEKLTFSTVN